MRTRQLPIQTTEDARLCLLASRATVGGTGGRCACEGIVTCAGTRRAVGGRESDSVAGGTLLGDRGTRKSGGLEIAPGVPGGQ